MKSSLLADRGLLVLPAAAIRAAAAVDEDGGAERGRWLTDQEVTCHAPWLRAYDRRRLFLPVRVYERCKRALDLTVALALLPAVALAVLACALAVWLESPCRWMFCWQERLGRGGVPFRALALRTTRPRRSPGAAPEEAGAGGKVDDGPMERATRVGRLLCRLGLVELPQLYNVFRGEMSVVGPRPVAPAVVNDGPWERCRLAVKPGFTGVSQITLRRTAPLERRLMLDLAYVHYRCLALDLSILLRAVPAALWARRPG